MRWLLIVHALLMVLASTAFTVVTSLTNSAPFQWCYFHYSFRNGFGSPYQSDYTLAVVVTYMLAFAVGLAGFLLAIRRQRPVTGTVGAVLCAMGLISFGMEGAHWLFDFHRSWLIFSPAAMIVLSVMACLPTGQPRAGGDEVVELTVPVAN